MCNYVFKPLIKKFRQQDMTAFGLLHEEYKNLIIFYSKRLGYEDAAQELTIFFIELLYDIELNLFKADSSIGMKKYIATALRNKYISLSKSKQKDEFMCNELFENSGFYCNEPEDRISIKQGLMLLSERQRVIIIYKYIYNYSDFEIANMLCISRQAVNRLKNRGLYELKKYYCIITEDSEYV